MSDGNRQIDPEPHCSMHDFETKPADPAGGQADHWTISATRGSNWPREDNPHLVTTSDNQAFLSSLLRPGFGRCAVHSSSASSAGHIALPQPVSQYSTLGGTCG